MTFFEKVNKEKKVTMIMVTHARKSRSGLPTGSG